MQKTTIIGNIGADADVRHLDSGFIAISFNVAVTEKRQEQDHTTWFSCTYWRKQDQSTAVATYLKKGQKVYVEGKISARSFTRPNGEAGASLDLRVDFIELCGQTPPQVSQPTQPQTTVTPTVTGGVHSPAPDAPTDDLPF